MSYDSPDFVNDVVSMCDAYELTDTRENEDDDSLYDLAVRVEVAFTQRRDLLEAAQKAHAVMVDTELDEYFDQGRVDEALAALREAIKACGAEPRCMACDHVGHIEDGECMRCGKVIQP